MKILEAMAAGVPVVSTSIGAEGITVMSNKDILLADTPVDFANSVLKLFYDKPLRSNIITQARRKVEQKYDWEIIARQHDTVYNTLRS